MAESDARISTSSATQLSSGWKICIYIGGIKICYENGALAMRWAACGPVCRSCVSDSVIMKTQGLHRDCHFAWQRRYPSPWRYPHDPTSVLSDVWLSFFNINLYSAICFCFPSFAFYSLNFLFLHSLFVQDVRLWFYVWNNARNSDYLRFTCFMYSLRAGSLFKQPLCTYARPCYCKRPYWLRSWPLPAWFSFFWGGPERN